MKQSPCHTSLNYPGVPNQKLAFRPCCFNAQNFSENVEEVNGCVI